MTYEFKEKLKEIAFLSYLIFIIGFWIITLPIILIWPKEYIKIIKRSFE